MSRFEDKLVQVATKFKLAGGMDSESAEALELYDRLVGMVDNAQFVDSAWCLVNSIVEFDF